MNLDTQRAEAYWRETHGEPWLATYRASATADWRQPMVDALRAAGPIQTVLDLGCNVGAMMPTLQAGAGIAVEVTGIDISAEAIREAKRTYPEHVWHTASLVEWLPMALKGIRRWDAVVASTTLSCVAPCDIPEVLRCVHILARDAIILQESAPTMRYPPGQANSGVLEWRHDYESVLARYRWRLASRVWQNVETVRPAAVLRFERP